MHQQTKVTVTPQEYRKTIGMFATGVTVVTSGTGDDLHAMTANAITSLSLNPILLIFCVEKNTKMAAQLQRYQQFNVNILRQEQKDLSTYFAGMWHKEEPPPFNFVEWYGGYLIEGCAAALSCKLHAMHDGGDHWIAVGKVVALYQREGPVAPLIYYRGRYGVLKEYENGTV